MNARIRELAEQCYETGPLGKDGWPEYSRLNQEKFAKLIVKECYVHCGGQLMDKNLAEAHGLTYNDGVMDCAIGLLQHFGVEE